MHFFLNRVGSERFARGMVCFFAGVVLLMLHLYNSALVHFRFLCVCVYIYVCIYTYVQCNRKYVFVYACTCVLRRLYI